MGGFRDWKQQNFTGVSMLEKITCGTKQVYDVCNKVSSLLFENEKDAEHYLHHNGSVTNGLIINEITLVTTSKENKKTQWQPLSTMKKDVEYWLLDSDNNVGAGLLISDDMIIYNLSRTPENFKPVMCAEMTWPTVPEL